MTSPDSVFSPTLPKPDSTMKAVVYDDYGDASVLHSAERPVPSREIGDVLIAVEASSVNPIDYRLRGGELRAILVGNFPRIPGFDVCGRVVEVDKVSLFKPGDRVMAYLDATRGGACAEYAVCNADVTAKIPDAMSIKEAAAIPLAGTTALQSLRNHGHIEDGKRVLINGASGGVGAFAVQIAKAWGCHVDAVASGDNRDFCMELGADHFYDYESTDFTDSAERWDLVFDVAGKSGYLDARSVLRKGGRFVTTEPDIKGILMTVLTWPLGKSGTAMLARPSANDLRLLVDLYEQGKLTVTIDSEFPMSNATAAHQQIENGVDRGKVILLNDF